MVPVLVAVTSTVNFPGETSVMVPKVMPAVPVFCRSAAVKVAASMSVENSNV